MLNAVWVAVIVAAAFWVVGGMRRRVCDGQGRPAHVADHRRRRPACASARSRSSSALTTTIDRANEQLVKTDAITASMDEVTANMAELTGRRGGAGPLARGDRRQRQLAGGQGRGGGVRRAGRCGCDRGAQRGAAAGGAAARPARPPR